MRRPDDNLAVALTITGVAAPASVALAAPQPVRAVVVLAVVLIVPGIALVRLSGIDEPERVLVLALAVSLALDVLVGTALLYLRVFSPVLAMSILGAVSVAASAPRLVPERTRT